MTFLEGWARAWRETPEASKWTRLGLAAIVGVGCAIAISRSLVFTLTVPIPFKVFPDVRLPVVFLAGFALALYGSGGESRRRAPALAYAILIAIASHMEVATVHWFLGTPGSITGTRLDWMGFGGSLAALAAVAILHVEVEAWRYANDLAERGVPREDADAAAVGLSRAGATRALAVAAGVAALAGLVLVAERVIGESTLGAPLFALLAGASLLAVGLLYAVRSLRSGA